LAVNSSCVKTWSTTKKKETVADSNLGVSISQKVSGALRGVKSLARGI